MSRIKGLAAIFGAAVLMAVIAACGNAAEPTSLSDEEPTLAPPTVGGTTPTDSIPPTTPIVSHGGPVKDYVSLVDNLRAAGATVDPAGTGSADFFAPQGQVLTVNGERVETFEFASAEEANAAAEGVSASGDSISRSDSETGMGVASSILWEKPPHFHKAGKLIVLYVACDVDVINLLQETMGPQFAGGAGLSRCPDRVPPTNMEIRQALDAAEGSEVMVSGFLFADRQGNTRLCSGLLESYPPQCGGDRIDLLGLDASSVPNSKTPQRRSEIGTVRWTDSYITITGIKGIAGLAEVRLLTEAPATVGGTTPEEEPATSQSPIEFVMEDTYALGQDIEIKIRNNGTESYVYSEYYPACRNLEFYDGSQQARQLERLSGIVELSPGLFIVPEGTHCDIANESQIKPGEEVALLTWSQHECVKDKWGCIESVPVKAGRYTIVGRFPESKGSSEPNALSFQKAEETVAELSFTIGPSDDAQTGSPVISGGAPLLYLNYEGAVYHRTYLSTDEAANLNENDLERVGTTTESNLLLPTGSELRRYIVDLNHDNPELSNSEIKDRVEANFQIGLDNSTVGRTLQGGLNIYKLKDGEEGYVYTFEPGQSMVNPEDGQIFEFPAEWIRWAAADSNET